MNRTGDDLLLEALKQREDYIHEAADSIDTKAGLVLAAAAFLAVQPAVLLAASNVPKLAFGTQLVSFIALSIAVYNAHKVLRIEGYPSPGFDEDWRTQIIYDAPERASEEAVRSTILWGLVDQAKLRIEQGIQINESKLTQLGWARRWTTASFFLNMAILIVILMQRVV